MLKCWGDFQGYSQFVTVKWSSFQINGWGGFLLKEKLCLIKGSLQEWHQHHSRNVEGGMKAVKDIISSLDSKAEETVLLEEEEEEKLHELSVNRYSLARVHSNIY
jgi:hypothetical protein